MRLPAWLGVAERRWKKAPGEEVQPSKTVWDWLQLLIVPVMLAAIAFYFSASQASRDHSREDRRIREDRRLALAARQDATLQSYFTQMSELMLDRRLLESQAESGVREVARTVTLATVRRLDGRRRGEVVRFLVEADLLTVRPGESRPPVDLGGADLRGAELAGTFFPPGSSLRGVDLRRARLDGARLQKTNLSRADLRNASLRKAVLEGVSLLESDLRGAVFDGSELKELRRGGVVTGTNLASTCLTNTSFVGAVMYYASFAGAQGRGLDFRRAQFLSWADWTQAVLTDVRLGGPRPALKGWGPTGTTYRPKEKAEHPCADMYPLGPGSSF